MLRYVAEVPRSISSRQEKKVGKNDGGGRRHRQSNPTIEIELDIEIETTDQLMK